ncbi:MULTISPECIES: hypothetical protein [Meiothermus]|jgi:hypothetical protein|uniref:Uncharacterized protein n=3 Tax=Meiothermus TaxID=65551 RepID=A0A399DYB2_9DEIN|nr:MULTISPECIES: hypothetical protein [Meiothermus]AWR88110.1 hypothetical protein Mtai_v1c28890 [Meiothermus taiwanensis WR-220]KIQ53405.1 hypothetical protein SY28_14065 [Meiothermus taiwanensis]KZK14998.1 hypothetical protein A3962_11765 [Meiothermus taiwanensis]RIH76489.1 hypothetical protein Mcate_01761 [Meiothermus taiwanensis]RIH84995.1 hypothetical protein Mlute_01727 [Meiothermus luteus]
MPEGHQELCYVLRMWSDGEQQWRYSLEPLRGGGRQGFAHMEDLLMALERAKEEACATQPESQP